jgi:flagellar hook-associated protein 1 FlgK
LSSSFFGLTIGMSALSVSQQALEIISHNIANINTPGYSRQEAVIKTTDPQYLPSLNRSINSGQLGTGVTIEQVRRLRDQYADNQLRFELQNQGKLEYSVDILQQSSIIFSEPGDNSLSNTINGYWNAWKDLEASPEDTAKRQSLVEKTKILTSFFQSIYTRINQTRYDIDTEIKNKAQEINNYSSQITKLNKIIKDANTVGDTPNDLMDRRDLLIDKLSKIVNLDVKESRFGQIDIFVGTKALVRGEEYCKINTALNPVTGYNDVLWLDDSTEVDLQNGEIYALKNFRDVYLPALLGEMDSLASTLITNTNALHSTGYGLNGTSTGYDFFTGSGIKDIEINSDLENDPRLIAASVVTDQAGDNTNITNILSLRDSLLLGGGTLNFDNYYNNIIIKLGVDSQQCTRELENTNLLIDKINLRKDSISGVSLDEELVNMVKYQHAYNAAAKIISTMDELLDTLINKM